jgi:hypothetical protein
MPLSPAQQSIVDSDARFRVCISGRRFGKTHLAIRELCKFASQPNKTVWYVAPSYRMAKQIVWDQLKERLKQLRWIKRINESDLSIVLVNGTKISLRGADNEDSMRGVGLAFCVLDEFSDIDPKAWYEVLRPTLSDTGGHALFCGTPKGIGNWAYDLYQQEKIDVDNWKSFQYTTVDGGQVPIEEIEQAKHDLDQRTFEQEYLASFITFKGTIYYNYTKDSVYKEDITVLKEAKHIYIGMDFNIDPMSACVATKTKQGLVVFDEITIHGSNTDEMVQEIKSRYPNKGITVFPDPASRQRKTSAAGRTDLSILVNAGFRTLTRPRHPAVRDRINAVNSAFKSADGEQKLWITPNCKNVIRSLSRQIYKEGTSIPDNNENLSHMNDALGYMVEYMYPITRNYINTNNTPSTWGVKVS